MNVVAIILLGVALFALGGCSASQQAAERVFLQEGEDAVCRACAMRAALAAPSSSSSSSSSSSTAAVAPSPSAGAPR